jgi:hypothetical protein
MRNLLLACFLSFSVCASAQTAASPFKGANIILIQTPDSASAALKKMAGAFLLAGFVPDKLDTELGYLTTQPKSFGQMTPAVFTYKVVARANPPGGAILELSGEYTVPLGLRSLTSSMHWYKGNLTQDKACFNEAEKAAKAYPGGIVQYTVTR